MSAPQKPTPDRVMWQYGQKIEHFTADQMDSYARDCSARLRLALERLLSSADVIDAAEPGAVKQARKALELEP